LASKGVVSKLSYRAKGPFSITADLGKNSFEVQQYDDPSSSKRKYKNTDIYLLPPALFPLQLFDTIEQRYLNSTYDPIVNPLKKSTKIELYSEKWLRKPNSSTPTHSTIVDKPSSNLDARAFLPHPDIFPTITALHKETNTIPIVHDDESPPPLSVSKLSSSDTPDFFPSSVPNNPTDDVV